MPFIDFAELKARVSIEETAQRLELELTKSGAQFRAACSACKTGGPRALVITPAKNLFYCFAAEKGGDQIALVAHVRECEVGDAAKWLSGTSTKVQVPSTGTVQVSKERANAPDEKGFKALDYLEHDHAAVEAAGFNPAEAETLGIGYAPKGIMRGTVAVPIRDESGRLLGYIGVTEARCPPKGFLATNVVPITRKSA
jgi:DNA primase